MPLKVASICPTTEKEWKDGELVHMYPYPEHSLDEAVAIAQGMVERCVPMIRQAAEQGAQMACLPEVLPNLGRWRRTEPLPSRREAWKRTWDHFCRTLSDAARECAIYLAAGAVEPRDGKYFNASALFDDRGNITGIYHKVQLVRGESDVLDRGDSFPVFPTPHGNVGMFICWDILFPEVTQSLMLGGAQILLQPTYGHAGRQADFQAQTRAHDAVCPLVVSMWCGNGRIIDKDGTILAAGGMHRDWRGIIPDQILYAEVEPRQPRKYGQYPDLRAGFIEERQEHAYRTTCETAAQTDLSIYVS